MAKTIYALLDPRTQEARYVGATQSPLWRRLTQHIANARQELRPRKKVNRTPVEVWVNELSALRVRPIIVSLEGPVDDWEPAEVFWIGCLRSLGANLLNQQVGGINHIMGPEHRAKLSAQRRGVRKSPEHAMAVGLALRGVPKSPSHRKALSEARRGELRPNIRGSRNPGAKLDESKVMQIRLDYRGGGISHSALARRYGVNPEVIRLAILGRTWKHVPMP